MLSLKLQFNRNSEIQSSLSHLGLLVHLVALFYQKKKFQQKLSISVCVSDTVGRVLLLTILL